MKLYWMTKLMVVKFWVRLSKKLALMKKMEWLLNFLIKMGSLSDKWKKYYKWTLVFKLMKNCSKVLKKRRNLINKTLILKIYRQGLTILKEDYNFSKKICWRNS